jgi:hypothetical protein
MAQILKLGTQDEILRGLRRAETKGRWLGWKRLPLLRAVEEGRGEEARWLDAAAPLSNSLPAGRGERENAAVHAQHTEQSAGWNTMK